MWEKDSFEKYTENLNPALRGNAEEVQKRYLAYAREIWKVVFEQGRADNGNEERESVKNVSFDGAG